MKLCKDCKHHQAMGDDHICNRLIYFVPDPVLGGELQKGTILYCRPERAYEGASWCGPNAKHWEAKDAQATA